MKTSEYVLEIRKVSKSFGKRPVLRGIDLELRSNQSLVITGPSGSGKSTLLRLIAGLETPSNGEIYLSGELASRDQSILISPHDRGIAMVFQDLGLWPNLTVLGNVMLGLSGLKLSRRERLDRARAAIGDCQIEPASHEYPHRLSVGEQQRVALARAMAVQPRLLLLDEPFTGLDLVLKDLLLGQMSQLSRKLDMQVVLVSHFPPDAVALNAVLAVLEDDVIREQGQLDALLLRPGSQTLAAWQRRLRGQVQTKTPS